MEFPLITKRMKRSLKTTLLIISIFFFCTMVFWLVKSIRNDSFEMGTFLFFVCLLSAMIIFKYRTQIRQWGGKDAKAVISENGIDIITSSHARHIDWNDIGYVVITKHNKRTQIRFFIDKYYEPKLKMPYWIYPIELADVMPPSFVFMYYSEQALELVKQYFDKPITDEYKLYLKGVG